MDISLRNTWKRSAQSIFMFPDTSYKQQKFLILRTLQPRGEHPIDTVATQYYGMFLSSNYVPYCAVLQNKHQRSGGCLQNSFIRTTSGHLFLPHASSYFGGFLVKLHFYYISLTRATIKQAKTWVQKNLNSQHPGCKSDHNCWCFEQTFFLIQ